MAHAAQPASLGAVDADASADQLDQILLGDEAVALEEGVGVSYAGKRAIVSMKHVG